MPSSTKITLSPYSTSTSAKLLTCQATRAVICGMTFSPLAIVTFLPSPPRHAGPVCLTSDVARCHRVLWFPVGPGDAGTPTSQSRGFRRSHRSTFRGPLMTHSFWASFPTLPGCHYLMCQSTFRLSRRPGTDPILLMLQRLVDVFHRNMSADICDV